jgi:hypothetical protein
VGTSAPDGADRQFAGRRSDWMENRLTVMHMAIGSFTQRNGLAVVADVHTHPTEWTGQSHSDRTHPMVAVKGHIALILPDYAAPNSLPLNGASVYEYEGSHKWTAHNTNSAPFKITIV